MKNIQVLIGFEESQEVTKAFRKLGCEAYSCDLKKCSGGHSEWHLQMDIYKALKLKEWDFIGIHPTCTKMTLSGNRTYGVGKPRHNERIEAVEWTIKLWTFVKSITKHGYMENPMGAMNGDNRLSKPQIIHPYYFGDPYQKQTCLWLHGLPPLLHFKQQTLFGDKPTHVHKGEMHECIDAKTGKVKKQPLWYAQAKGFGGKQKNKDFSEARSKTFPGIANAIANQWSEVIKAKQFKL